MTTTISRSYPPIPSNVVDQLCSCIISSPTKIRLKTDSVIVFVCGGQSSQSCPTARDIFMAYAIKNIKQYKFLMAEHVFNALEKRISKDLLFLEGELARFSDCIIIILESPGANAELGAFALHEKLVRLLLVINSNEYKNVKSFITDGPIARVNNYSTFEPAIYADFDSILSIATEVERRLNRIRKRAEPVLFASYDDFLERDYRERMLFLADIIAMFSPMSHSDLINMLKSIYGDQKYSIHMEIAVLIATGLVKTRENLYIRTLEDRGFFYEFYQLKESVLRAQVVNYYHKYCKKRTDLLSKLARGEG